MNKILLIILINIIIILGYKYKISLYILPFIFIIGCVLYIKLTYIKDNELVEGFYNEDVLSYWNQIEDTAEKDIKGVEDNLINKIDSVVELLTKLETSDNKYAGQQCEGEFKLTKSHKECGINAYDEYKYVISKQGDNCEYMPGYTYREKKELCKIDQECKDEGDCDKGAKCVKNKCKIGFECSSTELDNCNKEECKELNDRYGGFMYEFLNGKCTTSRCNVNEYFNCNTKDTCEGLGFNYEWDPKKLPRCQKKVEDLKICSEIECPDTYFHIHENKNKACRRPVNEGQEEELLIDEFTKIVEINDKKYLDRCNTNVCCQPSYKCGQYFHDGNPEQQSRCTSIYTVDEHLKIVDLNTKPGKCVNAETAKDPYKTFNLGDNTPGEIYYIWQDVDLDGSIFSNNPDADTRENRDCINDNCSNCREGESICTCQNGSEKTGLECQPTGNSIQCKNCKRGYYLDADGSCQQCPDRTFQNNDTFTDGECTSCDRPQYAVGDSWDCDKITGDAISVTCEAGYENVNQGGISSCSACPAGKYRNAGESSCSPCPAGTASSAGSSECTTCTTPPGATDFDCNPNSGELTSIKCNAGLYVTGTPPELSCAQCEPGTYQEDTQTESTECLDCPSGSYTTSPGSSKCSDCDLPINAYSGECVSSTGILTSITCKAGYKVSGTGSNSSCEPCEYGTYQPNDGSNRGSCLLCDNVPQYALDYGKGNECDRTSGIINGHDVQDGVKCIDNYTWVPNPERADHGSCTFQGCPAGHGIISYGPEICNPCDFNKYNPTVGNTEQCQTCPTPDPYLVYQLSAGSRNSVDDVPPVRNYCDAITGVTKINATRTAKVGGCKFESSQKVGPPPPPPGTRQVDSDTCGLPTCRDAFGVPESGLNSRLPNGQTNSGIVRTALNDNSGTFWYDGNTCAYTRPYNDQRCKTFFNRNDENLGQYCSGATNMPDCGFYLTRTTGTVDGFTRCAGSGSSLTDTKANMQAVCENSNRTARCRNDAN